MERKTVSDSYWLKCHPVLLLPLRSRAAVSQLIGSRDSGRQLALSGPDNKSRVSKSLFFNNWSWQWQMELICVKWMTYFKVKKKLVRYLRNSTNRSKFHMFCAVMCYLVINRTGLGQFLQFAKNTLLFLFFGGKYFALGWPARQPAAKKKKTFQIATGSTLGNLTSFFPFSFKYTTADRCVAGLCCHSSLQRIHYLVRAGVLRTFNITFDVDERWTL